MEFTLAKTIREEGIEVGILCFLVGLAADEGWIEPTTPSTRIFESGLVGSVLGQGAWGIRSYRVSD